MSEIVETEEGWELVLHPNAPIVSVEDRWDERGFIAEIGGVDGEYTIAKVLYDKKLFTLDKIREFANNIDCPICNSLNKESKTLRSIRLRDQEPPAPAPQPASVQLPPAPASSSPFEYPKGKSNSQDIFMKTWFDVFLTDPGKFWVANALGDEEMLDSLVPKTVEEKARFAAEMADFFAGNQKMAKSPEQLKEYVSSLREALELSDAEPQDLIIPSKKYVKTRPRTRRGGTKFI